MSHEARQLCARTNAVLAVHLDGDLWPTDLDRETFGYAFVSDDSLHAHLRECTVCQQALQRSRRLDAALASTAGRDLAQHDDLGTLGDRWLQNARVAAASRPHDDGFDPFAPGRDLDDELPAGEPAVGDAGLGAAAGSPTTAGPAGSARPVSWLAAGLVAAAAAAAWMCLVRPNVPEPARREHAAAGPLVGLAPVFFAAEQALKFPIYEPPSHATAAAPESAGAASNGSSTDAEPAPASLPLSLARRMRAGRSRIEQLPEQRTWSLQDLGLRIASRSLDVPDRLAAAERLIRRTRPGSSSARAATDELLDALAACSDRSEHELLVHEELLESVRDQGSLLVRLEHRLTSISGAEDTSLDRREEAAVLVAARVGTQRLDHALRRAVRRRPAVAEVLAASLRCGVRITGAPELLLDCWHDLVALGRHDNAPQWASFWFSGQAATTIDLLPEVLRATRSTKARERVLLAMGTVADTSTVKLLVARLTSPRRGEACAAACALAMLPHRVLEPLLPKARRHGQSLLRAALARAGVPAAQSWVRPLGLSRPQLSLLRDAPLKRFPEVVAWFRNGYAVGD